MDSMLAAGNANIGSSKYISELNILTEQKFNKQNR